MGADADQTYNTTLYKRRALLYRKVSSILTFAEKIYILVIDGFTGSVKTCLMTVLKLPVKECLMTVSRIP